MQIGRGGGAVNTNTRVGTSALAANTSGSQNTAFGYQALFTNNIGASNTAIGHRVLRAAGVGNNNIGIGKDALLVTLSGSKNLAIGNNAMETNSTGSGNVCIGHYAGFDVQGNNNVLIGPAYNETSADVTFRPPNISGDNQLVIGSGGQAWLRGDSSYNISTSQNLTVDGDTLIKGDLTVNGTTTTIKSNIVQITDKAIELAAVVSTQFTCTAVSGSANIVAIAPTLGLIPGMEITSNTAGITVPAGTIIVSITNDTAVLSNNVTGSGTPTFSAIGPSDTAAEDGGIIVKGTSDKTFLWRGVDGGVTYNSWTSSEHIDLASGKNYYVNGILIASDTNKVIGPTNGGGQGQIDLSGAGVAYTLGSAVTGSSLTSVGTLSALTVSDNFKVRPGNTSNATCYMGVVGKSSVNYAGGNADTACLRIEDTGSNNGYYHGLEFRTRRSGDIRLYAHDQGDNLADFVVAVDNGSVLVERLRIQSSDGDLVPGSDNAQDLGASNLRWANVYSGDVHLNNTGMGGNEVDGTEGNWTMQEGADDLFLINRTTGKKYKFNLTEV
jgi:hypothetical protein